MNEPTIVVDGNVADVWVCINGNGYQWPSIESAQEALRAAANQLDLLRI